ncbi:hypothetical protein BCU19_15040 [Vibrio cyclitrophicus]|uniref:hypothetical protein n=1 Tax=Vibrio cyclitrophicus TaxID=47951 RepID=UPI000C866473|nr:hypothetical protein [Vibrio cyclitrophicus]PMJ56948.1 hypothetical protein BCU19_13000 [Vibrio cyclitrophicus]
MKEIFQVLEIRIRSPFMGYFTFSFIALNWKGFFYILASSESPADRIVFFENNTDSWTLFWSPFLIGALITIGYPWLASFFVYCCEKPTQIKNALQANTEHALLVEKQKLQEQRRKALASAEQQLIEQAERDQEIEDSISDNGLKQKVKHEINELRQTGVGEQSRSPLDLLNMAAQFRSRADKVQPSSADYNELIRKAVSLEDEAYKLMVN